LGSALYGLGGFSLPFFSVGSVTLAVAVLLLLVVPSVETEKKDKTDGGKTLTFSGLFRVTQELTIRKLSLKESIGDKFLLHNLTDVLKPIKKGFT
jgi:hypothetical protein